MNIGIAVQKSVGSDVCICVPVGQAVGPLNNCGLSIAELKVRCKDG